MSIPKVSIIIPTYQQVIYLKRLLDSIQCQQFEDYEVIINDDSYTDDVKQLVATYSFGGRLRYHHNQPALGNPVNWNIAIKRARGEYIKVMMHDDWFIDNSSLGKFVQLLDHHPEAQFGFAVQEIWHAQEKRSEISILTRRQQKKLAQFPEWLFFNNYVGVPSATIFRRTLNQFFDPKLKYKVDLEFALRAIKSNKRFAYHPAPLVRVPVGLSFQITNECVNNKHIELFEAAHIFNKLAYKKSDPRFFYFWMKFLHAHGIEDNDPDFQNICEAYPAIANYLVVAQKGSKLYRKYLKKLGIRHYYLVGKRLWKKIQPSQSLKNVVGQ